MPFFKSSNVTVCFKARSHSKTTPPPPKKNNKQEPSSTKVCRHHIGGVSSKLKQRHACRLLPRPYVISCSAWIVVLLAACVQWCQVR